LYGLKQAGRRWYQTFTDILVQLGFTQCSVDQAVYHKSNASARELMVIAVHVDDCTIAASERRLMDDFKACLSKHVKVTDLGELHWMLGIEVKRNREAGTVHLSQRSYIDSILHRFNFADLKPLTTPMDVQAKLTSEQAPATAAEFAAMRNIPYREAVGALNWAALATRPVTDLQGPPSERTQSDKIRDLKSLAKQYARDQGSCDDTRISYLEYVESEAEADWTLARMIAG
jgi:hypothetical protein